MPQIEFSEMPGDMRVKLSDKAAEQLWTNVDKFGIVREISEYTGFSQSKIYNWKNKDLALPFKFLRTFLDQNLASEIISLKGEGSSGKIEDPVFPLEVSDELLTRIEESVKLNSDKTPVYLTSEMCLVERFSELLGQLGGVEYKVYSRESRFELRYPKFLHSLLTDLDYNTCRAALIDESGQVVGGKIKVRNKLYDPQKIRQNLYSREKKFELALNRQDSDEIANLMAEESAKVRKLLGN